MSSSWEAAWPRPVGEAVDESREIKAILGPTNTGKTHYAIERMLTHRSGVIGLPLRLLAREVYSKVAEKAGAASVALITGEERVNPGDPRYWVCTVEAMPRAIKADFLAVDEIQLAADLERGHTFTDRLLNYRGRVETMFLGAATIEPVVRALAPQAQVATRPRLSSLVHAGHRKLTRLPHRSAVVAFSSREVYEIAELLRRCYGGAAVVLGALSPRTRNAQVELYQNRDVDYIVATDAIGMGLNLDIEHVAFASDQKFDGREHRRLSFAEFAQIAGRAGRNHRNGSFGAAGRCAPFEPELVDALESHVFEPVARAQWRNSELDFASIDALQESLRRSPEHAALTRCDSGDDIRALDILAADADVRRAAKTVADVGRLWDACQIPDYRNISAAAHAELVKSVFEFIVRKGNVSEDWYWRQLSNADQADGDLDQLSSRIEQVRSCAYMANRSDWLADPGHWQVMARQVEDRLSDALHERLAQRFVDRRTSMLLRRHRENAMLSAQVTQAGDLLVEGQKLGRVEGFRFSPDPQAGAEAAKVASLAIAGAVTREADARAARLSEAVDASLVLASDGAIRWLGEPVAKLAPGEKLLQPRAVILADEAMSAAAKDMAQRRLDLWIAAHVRRVLGALLDLEAGEGLEGAARGVAFQLAESLGVLERGRVAQDVKGLDQNARGAVRKLGVRFGAYYIYVPALLKPGPRALALQLWALKNERASDGEPLTAMPQMAAAGRTSFVVEAAMSREALCIAGFRLCGERAVRVDILERLADLIRPAVAYRPGTSIGPAPPGAAEADGFVVTVAMTSLTGCSGEALGSILRSMGFEARKIKGATATGAPTAPPPTVTDTPSGGEQVVAAPETATSASAGSPLAPELTGDAADETCASAAPPSEVALSDTTPTDAPSALDTPGAPVAPAATAPAAEDEALIEVWRPVHRRKRSIRPPRRHQPQARSGAADIALARDRAKSLAPQEASLSPEAGAAPAADQTPGPSAPKQEPPHLQRESKDRQELRASKARGREFRTGGPTQRPVPRERPVDPNSPFAKLLALKSQLEAKQRGE